MEYKKQNTQAITPRLIIQGGAGNILPSNLPPQKYKLYHDSLLRILTLAHEFLTTPPSFPLSASNTTSSTSALDTVTLAVTLLEDNPLFNSGHGAVFTRTGINELEASLMVSRGKKKRGVGLMGLQHVKNPIKLAREMLLHGEDDIEAGNGEHRGPKVDFRNGRGVGGVGAQGHSQLHKYSAEELAREWGLEMVEPSYYFVQSRWDEHIKGLEKETKEGGDATWDAESFFPQGTCGAVALDSEGVIACATSTGGMTNKLTGRIGDTPTLGAGFWAEEWEETTTSSKPEDLLRHAGPALVFSETLIGLIADCFPDPTAYSPIPQRENQQTRYEMKKGDRKYRSTGLSGTGNGDSFLRLAAARTASAIPRYRPNTSLQSAVTEVSGPGGDLVKSAGKRWRKTGEGEGGIVGIELTVVRDKEGEVKAAESEIVYDFNCGGMFRAEVDGRGKAVMRVWKEGQYEGIDLRRNYPWEGREYDVREWLDEKMF